MREYHVRFCEGLGVKFPGPTRQKQTSSHPKSTSAYNPASDILVAVTDFRVWPEAEIPDRCLSQRKVLGEERFDPFCGVLVCFLVVLKPISLAVQSLNRQALFQLQYIERMEHARICDQLN